MKVEVIRDTGSNQAPDIIDELCTEESAGLQRGRNYLDENGFDKKIYDMTLPYKLIPLPGSVALISDSSLGQTFRGKVISWNLTIEGASITTAVSIERSMDA